MAIALGPAAAGGAPPETLTIDQAVSEALGRNLGLLAERLNIPVADAQIITARLRPNPVLSLGADHLDLLGTGFNDVNNAGPSEYSGRVDFLLERGGKRTARIGVAAATRSVTEYLLADSVRGLILEVQSAFVDVLLAADNLALARESLQAFNEILAINGRRLKAGDLAEVEYLRVSVATIQFQNVEDQAQLRLQAATNRLQLLLGRTEFAPTIQAAGPLRRPDGELDQAALRAGAFARRPDLLAARGDQARSAAELRLQLATGKIDYTVGGEYRRQQGFGAAGNMLGFFISAPLPVFNRNQGEIERARRQQQQAAIVVRSAEQSVGAEVDVATKQFLTSRRLVERFERDLLGRARDVRQITEFSYRRGEANFLEFLDAQKVFNETMQGYNEARAELARTLYLMDAVSARGVTP